MVAVTAVDRDLSSLTGYWFQRLVELGTAHVEEAGYRAVLSVGHGGQGTDFLSSITLLDQPN
jgi:hypothetical protein